MTVVYRDRNELITLFNTYKRIIMPWKERFKGSEDYKKGWNACLREINKNNKKFMKFMEGVIINSEGL